MDTTGSTDDDARTGRVAKSAADVYDEFFVPALFGQFAEPACAAARAGPGRRLLDVGTGTGVVARAAAAAGADVVAVDPNPAMIEVARRHRIQVRRGAAEDLPFEDASFDAAVAQFVLMFCDDRPLAAAELARVTKPGGRVVVTTWADASESPGYAAMIELLDEVIGTWAADALRAPFVLGSAESVEAIVRPALPSAEVTSMNGTARFDSVAAWLHTDVRGWTLADRVDDDQYAELQRRATDRLAEFVRPDGGVEFAAPAWLAVATVG